MSSTSKAHTQEPAGETWKLNLHHEKSGYTKIPEFELPDLTAKFKQGIGVDHTVTDFPYNTQDTAKGHAHATALQAMITPKIQSFAMFPQLPAELRIKIWEYVFVPRTITLERHSSRPALNPRSVEGLLLVNHEARQLFQRSYTRCFHVYGLPAIYINFDLDTLCLSGDRAKHALKKLLKQYTLTMSRVKYLDVYSDSEVAQFDWGGCNIRSTMSSLQLLTVKLPSSDPTRWKWTRSDMDWIITQNMGLIAKAMGKYDRERESEPMGVSTTPRLAAIFSPAQGLALSNRLEAIFRSTGPCLVLVEPTESTWDRIEATMCDDLRKIWPGRESCRQYGWFIYEFARES